jgi:hypothetical protein
MKSTRRRSKIEDEHEEEEDEEKEETWWTGYYTKVLISIRKNIIRPFFIGASGAFGVSVGT